MSRQLLNDLGLSDALRHADHAAESLCVSVNPATNEPIAGVPMICCAELDSAIQRTVEIQRHWRRLPAPLRGEVVRQIGNKFRLHRDDLGRLITLEVGKIRSEGIGEVQECIDIADFAVGLSRQLYGLSMHSERASHRMYEQWHPLGVIGVITAFNFPAAVWAWNAIIAAVCGDAVIWKPSLLAPITALAVNKLARKVMHEQEIFRPAGLDPADLFQLVIGTDEEVGEPLVADRRIPLISATGSCRMGNRVGQVVAGRLGRTLLELGGNNAVIVMPDADLALAERAIAFGAVGTAGQRCTTTRRLLVHESISGNFVNRLAAIYRKVKIGDPADSATLMGPLINSKSVDSMRAAIKRAVGEGGRVICGGEAGIDRFKSQPGNFVEPTIIHMPRGLDRSVADDETFAPILYVFDVKSLDEAIAMNNRVAQGLSSAVFTDSVRAAERFLSAEGSDCGIANINIGTSGAEIGGAFGGEKDTGGGRESGSDSWKSYMRRQTCTINFGTQLPLAQGVTFDVD